MHKILTTLGFILFVGCSSGTGSTPRSNEKVSDEKNVLSMEEMKIAQEKTSALFSFNNFSDLELNPDVLILGGAADTSEYIFYSHPERGGLSIEPTRLGERPEADRIVKDCVIAQAKELNQISDSLPEFANLFKVLRPEIDVYSFARMTSESSELRRAFIGGYQHGASPYYLYKLENALMIGIQLNIELMRETPCSVVPAESIIEKIENLRPSGKSSVKTN